MQRSFKLKLKFANKYIVELRKAPKENCKKKEIIQQSQFYYPNMNQKEVIFLYRTFIIAKIIENH